MTHETPHLPAGRSMTVELIDEPARAEHRRDGLHRDERDGQGRLIVTGSVLIADAWRLRDFDVDGLCSPLIIDLSAVTALDVAGVAAVADLARRMLARGRGVQIVAPTDPHAHRTAKMTGVLELLNRQSPVAFVAA